MADRLTIAVFGLGEAGRYFADALAVHADVVGFDPAWQGDDAPFRVVDRSTDAVDHADVVLVLTAGSIAERVFDDVSASVPPAAVYADLSSSSPSQKKELADRARTLGFRFADVTLLAPVPRAGIATPAQASGDGAERIAELLNPLGTRIEPVGSVAGDAAARKLLRSVVVKGLTALLIESLRAAEELDLLEWFSDHIDETLTGLDTPFLTRLIEGTTSHSERRVHEMLAAVEMIEAAGGTPYMANATRKVLETAPQGIPRGTVFR